MKRTIAVIDFETTGNSPQGGGRATEIAAKKLSVRDDALLLSDSSKKMGELWDKYWSGGSGAKAP